MCIHLCVYICVHNTGSVCSACGCDVSRACVFVGLCACVCLCVCWLSGVCETHAGVTCNEPPGKHDPFGELLYR